MSESLTEKIKILVADDHKMVSQSLQNLIQSESDMEVAALAQNGQEVLAILADQSIDVLLLDITMPVMDGLETLPKVKSRHPQVQILALTTHDDGELVKAIMEGGAMGYLLKSESYDHLIYCIRMVNQKQRVLNLELTSKMLDSMQHARKKMTEEIVMVTSREKEVLWLLADGLTSQQIAGQLFISENTVITHKKKLFSKFGVCNGASLVKKAMQQGFFQEAV